MSGRLGGSEARDAQAEAMNILTELVRVHPQWGEARFLLGRTYAAMANLERDLGKPADAERRLGMAVQTLSELSKSYPDNPRYLLEFARQKAQQAQILADLKKPRDAVPAAQEAITTLESMLQKEAALDVLDRKACGVLLAQAYGIQGHAAQLAKNSVLARTAFAKASGQWEKVKTQHGDDEVIEAGLTWTKDRLAKLK